jgi:hypothetical protein
MILMNYIAGLAMAVQCPRPSLFVSIFSLDSASAFLGIKDVLHFLSIPIPYLAYILLE